MHSPRPTPIRRRCSLLSSASVFIAGTAAAAEATETGDSMERGCPIVLDSEAEPTWSMAVSAAALHLRALAATVAVDCRHIEVRSGPGGAEVALITGDGRRAVRVIGGPGELAATVDALAVTSSVLRQREREPAAVGGESRGAGTTMAKDAGAGAAGPQTAAVVPRQGAPEPLTAPEPATQKPAGMASVLTLAGEAGVRAGDGKATPLLGARGLFSVAPWELGVTAQWEVRYVGIGDELEDGVSASGIGLRAEAGFRHTLSPSLALSTGVALGVATHELSVSDPTDRPPVDDAMEARPGVYTGMRLPATGPTGVHVLVLGEWVPPALETNAQSGLPRYAVTLALGLDAEVL